MPNIHHTYDYNIMIKFTIATVLSRQQRYCVQLHKITATKI